MNAATVSRPILVWGIVLLALMVFDVLISAGAINGTHQWLSEGNLLARSVGVWWLALTKIVFAVALSLYSLWRNSAKALKLASLIMLGLAAWNVAMLLVFRY
jgi:hypothetical protein